MVPHSPGEGRCGDRADEEQHEHQPEVAKFTHGLAVPDADEYGVEGLDGSEDIAGDEGGVVDEGVDGAETADLVAREDTDEGDEEAAGEGMRKQRSDEEAGGFKSESDENDVMPQPSLGYEGAPDSEGESDDGQQVMKGLVGVAAEQGDAEEHQVSGHGSGEDAAVSDVEKGVEEAAGEGEQEGGGK